MICLKKLKKINYGFLRRLWLKTYGKRWPAVVDYMYKSDQGFHV